ncbi:DnaB-like helicase C-terminal domain-containing protein [Methylotenera sp. G11]|uniref:DnaB-like helicase C-terminal domain-containing protein n=1 Tax=Methylotenera sp. G11 TaxID=1506585 RepID=UPI000AE18432|nr:DnaB-like helicase C-terminal domain-containing protein [Methylotenera sp. G11]
MRNDKLAAFDDSAQNSQGYLSSLMINESELNSYMVERDASEHANVKPASEFLNELITFFNSDSVYSGASLPWQKTHEQFRLRPGEVTLWAGFNGSGKSLVLGQIMLHLLKEQKACIASLEMKPVTTLARMCRQALGSNKPTDEYVKRFCERGGDKLWLYNQLGTVNSERIISVIHYAAEKLGVHHFVIDSLMKCGISDDDYTGQKHFVDRLCAAAKDTDCHIHLVAHSRKGQDELTPPGKMDVKGSGSITDQVDNVMTVWRNKRKEQAIASSKADEKILNEPDTLVICDKQRNGEWEGKIGLWFNQASMRFLESRNSFIGISD